MAFTKYFVELIKQDGPHEQTKVLVPLSPAMVVDSSTGVRPAPATTDVPDNSITPAKTLQVQARTATTDGLTTGIIADTATHVTVTSSSANNIVTLPTPTPGRMLVIDVGANGFKLQSSAPSTVAINGGSGSTAKSSIAASSTILAICISATAWKAIFLDADSDVAKVGAAA